ncbi:MAG TPA: hypothetical protein VFU79_00580 [Nitrososphaeraceae archaeon]|nr:hypothetical protein [Nitrososphaeraceae archaeon]
MPSTDSRIICNTCNREVGVTDVQNGINFDEYYLSCGHIQSIDKQDNANNKDKKSVDINNKNGVLGETINENHTTTCNICGLTARSINELEDHKYHAHDNKGDQNKRSAEQKIDPSP